MPANVYITGLAAELFGMGREVLRVDIKEGVIVFKSAGGFIATIKAWIGEDGLAITETRKYL